MWPTTLKVNTTLMWHNTTLITDVAHNAQSQYNTDVAHNAQSQYNTDVAHNTQSQMIGKSNNFNIFLINVVHNDRLNWFVVKLLCLVNWSPS